MITSIIKGGVASVLLLFAPQLWADSYRYLHVTIETPWMIFLFLFVAVMMPFILMAILYWRNAFRRNAEDDARAAEAEIDGRNGE